MASRKEKFANEISAIIRRHEMNIIEALSHYCEETEADMEDIIPLLDAGMRERVRIAAIENRYVTGFKLAQLPL